MTRSGLNRRLRAYYEDDKGGTATVTSYEVAGQDGVLLTASAELGGREMTIMLAIVKRGDECFRLRGSMPKSGEAKGGSVFRQFVSTFSLRSAPK